MKDIEAKFCCNSATVVLVTESFPNETLYVLSVENGPTKTKDIFKNFKEAFDSFTNIVKTLTKEI